MTAQAPYESLSRMADKLGMAVASADPLTAASVNRIAADLRALAALAERAPDDAVAKLQAFKDYVHQRLDAMGVPVDPESPHKAAGCRIGGRLDYAEARMAERAPVSTGGDVVRGLIDALIQSAFDDGESGVEEYGERVRECREDLLRALATPAPPVGADWVMVPRNPNDAMHYAGGGCLGSDAGAIERADRVYRAMLSAAATPAEARGVGDGVRALVAKWRAEANGTDILDCSKSGLMNYCADELEAALAANTRQAQAQGSEGVAVAQVWEDGAGERHIGWTVEDTDDYPPGTWLYVGGQNGKD